MGQLLIKRALLSVSDKSGLEELARSLFSTGTEIISSGGTRKFLTEKGIKVTPIEEVTKNPEAFKGRMKTLSFQVCSALLYKRDSEEDIAQAKELGILPIDLVVCNLYPFESVAKNESDPQKLVEDIDIGGPTMIRSAAKNYKFVAVLTDPSQYKDFLTEYDSSSKGNISLTAREQLSVSAFQHTARYDSAIASMWEKSFRDSKEGLYLSFKGGKELRYGENPHQKAVLIGDSFEKRGFFQTPPLQGKELSYNNILDADAALRSCLDFARLSPESKKVAVTVIKHSNPCGAALGYSGVKTLEMAWNGDPVSAFGSIICFSKEVDGESAKWLSDKFVEIVLAPSFSKEALESFSKKRNLRLLAIGDFDFEINAPMLRSVWGGHLVQNEDLKRDSHFENVTQNKFDDEKMDVATFGIYAGKHLKSNAIVLVHKTEEGISIAGAGMGNPNRLISLDQAVNKALANGLSDFSQMVLISDAFFPFSDNIDLANQAGIKYIVQPGGSIRDEEVIKACDQFDMAMVFTKTRHFRH